MGSYTRTGGDIRLVCMGRVRKGRGEEREEGREGGGRGEEKGVPVLVEEAG